MMDIMDAGDLNLKDLKDDDSKSGGVVAFVGEIIKITLIALAIILPVRYFLIKPFYVNGASMEPNYFNQEYLIVDEISYRFSEPSRGDVIVFRYPEDPKQFFIKRVIGLPGERVAISEGVVTIYKDGDAAGFVINEPYLAPEAFTAGSIDVTLGAEQYFVLGDNRGASLDSRRFGPLGREEIVGRVWLRGWPLDRVGVLPHFQFDR